MYPVCVCVCVFCVVLFCALFTTTNIAFCFALPFANSASRRQGSHDRICALPQDLLTRSPRIDGPDRCGCRVRRPGRGWSARGADKDLRRESPTTAPQCIAKPCTKQRNGKGHRNGNGNGNGKANVNGKVEKANRGKIPQKEKEKRREVEQPHPESARRK